MIKTQTPSHDEAIAATGRWLDRAVIGLNLCPFAKSVQVKKQVRYVVSNATDSDSLLADLERELQHLATISAEETDTTLLIHPFVLENFDEFTDFLDLVDVVVRTQGLAGTLQVANFHPDYCFSDAEPGDIGNHTNRSPYPTLHLIREASLDRAVAAFPDASRIYERNIETLERMGIEGWRALDVDAPKNPVTERMIGRPYVAPPDNGLDILYIDDSLLVVNKPSGLLSVPGRGAGKDDSLTSRVQAVYPEALTVHRLDMETSGLMVLARSKEMHRSLSILFQNRQVQKHYIAVVDGIPEETSGEIDLPLITDWPNRPLQKVDHEIGKPSLTRYRVLANDASSNCTRLELEPETGRSHQLRVRLMSLGHPILGDSLYASPALQAKAGRLLLHAERLAFAHPQHGEQLTFFCAAPF